MDELKTSGFAIASLIFGIIGLFIPFVFILAIIFSIIALVKISKQPDLFKGKGLAIAGIVLGVVGIILPFFLSGLGLTLIKTIFIGAQEQIPTALELTALEAQPSAANPITLSGTVKIKSGGTYSVNVGYYNKMGRRAENAVFDIASCFGEDGKLYEGLEIINLPQDVEPGKAASYNLIFEEKEEFPSGIYICNLQVVNDKRKTEVYETKQINVEIIA